MRVFIVIDCKLLIHLGEDKTKSILLSEVNGLVKINMFCSDQYDSLGCQPSSELSGKSMASKVQNKVDAE